MDGRAQIEAGAHGIIHSLNSVNNVLLVKREEGSEDDWLKRNEGNEGERRWTE